MVIHLEALVEEPSMEAALHNLLPKIVPAINFRIITFQGKKDLLKQLPARLRGYARWIPAEYRIVVLIDEDRQDCQELKMMLESAARQAGLMTKTAAQADGSFQVLNRIVIEELEAWFCGDIEALRLAYPNIPASLSQRAPYRHPDAILGGTWETLERVLQKAGYFKAGLAKKELAQTVSHYMQPERNHSPSFQTFCRGLVALVD
jgi:hypothetical protein